MHWTLWFHCSNNTSVLSGVMLPLKVLIFGVPKCRPNVRVVISCPISDLDGAGHGTCRGGPEGTLPPTDCSGSADGVGCLNGPYLPPPGKVTSQSSSSGSLLPNGHTHSFGGGLLGGTFIPHCAISCVRSSMSWCSSWSARSPSSPTWGSLLGRCMWPLSPHLRDLNVTLLGTL